MVDESERYLRKTMICKRPIRTLGRLAGVVANLIQNVPCC